MKKYWRTAHAPKSVGDPNLLLSTANDGAARAGPPGFDGVREKNLAIPTTRDRSREAVMHAVQFSRIVGDRGRGRPFDPINTFAASE
jgi:hypothetical protein